MTYRAGNRPTVSEHLERGRDSDVINPLLQALMLAGSAVAGFVTVVCGLRALRAWLQYGESTLSIGLSSATLFCLGVAVFLPWRLALADRQRRYNAATERLRVTRRADEPEDEGPRVLAVNAGTPDGSWTEIITPDGTHLSRATLEGAFGRAEPRALPGPRRARRSFADWLAVPALPPPAQAPVVHVQAPRVGDAEVRPRVGAQMAAQLASAPVRTPEPVREEPTPEEPMMRGYGLSVAEFMAALDDLYGEGPRRHTLAYRAWPAARLSRNKLVALRSIFESVQEPALVERKGDGSLVLTEAGRDRATAEAATAALREGA